MTSIEAVRLKASDKSLITREVTRGTGEAKFFKVKNQNIFTSPVPEVRLNDVVQTENVDYTVDYTQGVFTFAVIPVAGTTIEFTYYWSVFNDDEIQYFIDEAGGNTTIATAQLLLAWAADAARLAKRQTLSGGGGLGQVVIDTSVAAKELRATAAALIQTQADLGESIPAEGLTEIPYTEQVFKRQAEQSWIRRGGS